MNTQMDMYEMLKASKGATFSEDGKYRFLLWRVWEFEKPTVLFIGLNPSTANEIGDDPTINRVMAMAKSWGYGGIYMANLFPFITAYPSELEECSTSALKENDGYIRNVGKNSALVIFAWGAFETMGRDRDMIKMFPNAKALIMNDDGSPRHPLYVPKTTKPIPFTAII